MPNFHFKANLEYISIRQNMIELSALGLLTCVISISPRCMGVTRQRCDVTGRQTDRQTSIARTNFMLMGKGPKPNRALTVEFQSI